MSNVGSGSLREPAVDAAESAEIGRHIPGLDGLRALAILLVIPHNLDLLRPPVPLALYPVVTLMHAGWIGVQLFFVLSGFLITGNLLDTRGSENYFRAFFGRRALRILPLYYAVLLLAFVFLPASRMDQLWLATFLGNWVEPFGAGVHGFTHFWSLAVEEQFYLLWPLLVILCRPVALAWACAAVAIVALGVRIVLEAMHFPSDALYMFTICRMDALALGAAAACVVRIPRAREWFARFTGRLALAAALTLAATTIVTRGLTLDATSTQTWGYSLLSLGFALIVLLTALPQSGLTARLMSPLAWRPLRLIGRYSYGMYIFHLPLSVFIAFPLLQRLYPHITTTVGVAYVVVMTVVTFCLAAVSYELFESPFLRLKGRLMPRNARSAPARSAADQPAATE
jgi:peptidoglycan/LPS O-acetylase OafA/YrhL